MEQAEQRSSLSEAIRKHKEFLFPAVANYYQEPIALARGEGEYVWDDAGNQYLDCFGGVLTVMFAGSVIIEQIFEIPGMGRLSLDAIVGRDYSVFMGIISLTSGLFLAGNVLSDFCYVLIDPRIHFDR